MKRGRGRPRKSRHNPPWGDLLGEPIERHMRLSAVDNLFVGVDNREERQAETRSAIERDALAEQWRKMWRLKEYYGIEDKKYHGPWFHLALALASELDDALTIVDPQRPPRGKTAPRWRGGEGKALVEVIDCMRNNHEAAGEKVSVIALLKEHQERSARYRDMDLAELERKYYWAKEYHGKTAKRGSK